MPVLDVQRRGQQIGRIRIGEQVQAANGRMRPSKLETFRFTTGSRATAEAIAALYGGEIRDWLRGQFEVITEKAEIGVTVPPRDQVVSQWYELWSKGGCQRRCEATIVITLHSPNARGWPAVPIPAPSLARRMRHDRPWAAIGPRVARFVPRVNAGQT